MLKQYSVKWKTTRAIALLIIIIPIIVIFIPPIFPWYSDLPDNYKYFVSTTGATSVGIIIYLLKKKLDQKIRDWELNLNNLIEEERKKLSDSKELSLTAELYEIFLFLILPALALYGIISIQIKENPFWITGIFMSVIFIWHIIAQLQVSKQYPPGTGKIVKTHVDTLFIYMMILGGFFTVLIFIFKSF